MTCNLLFLRFKEIDAKNVNLHELLRGEGWAKAYVQTVIKFVSASDSLFPRISDAAFALLDTAQTKRQKFEDSVESPSTFASSIFDRAEVCDHRYRQNLHVSLQVEAFGKFIDKVSEERVTDSDLFYQIAGRLMLAMSKPFGDEKTRENDFLETVGEMFPSVSVRKNRAITDATIVTKVDGAACYLLNWEFKNELNGISSEPNRQNVGNYIQLTKGSNQRSPMLLVTVVGPHYFQVFGAVWYKEIVCVDPLCDPVSLLFVRRDPKYGICKVARVLAALHTTVNDLKQYYSSRASLCQKGPYFGQQSYTYGKKIGNRDWLYEAKCKADKCEIIVKFSRSPYGIEIHRLLAEQQWAPDVISHQALPGGWDVVVMEKVNGSPISRCLTSNSLDSLVEAVTFMHEKNFVHGDLRPQNILVVEDRVCIVDFDWAGKLGTVRYPPDLYKATFRTHWDSTVNCMGLIQKEHDLYQVETLRKQLSK